ncbi:zinc-dependent metalloprotease [Microlunatus aurantiacus]|uniref:Zinc-dependent metalloprotease n=1 Tax=Microlunatus aurantiacus TaxID=446786 RepID=A0ABP7EFD4_9ACTN
MTSSSMVDWTVALSTASRLVKPGPDISREGAAEAVADLRRCAVRAEAYVREVTGLTAPSGTAPVLVVDRPRWIEANLDGFRQVLAPLTTKTAERAKNSNPALVSIGARITGVEVGALLSYLAPKVLGQFDPFYPGVDGVADGAGGELPPGGRLLLVAPNIVAVERELDLAPGDFRLWVCLHEETHRVQFTAVPWLRGYLNTQIGEIVATADVDGAALAGMLREAVKRISEAARGDAELSIVDLVQTPGQREIVDRITAVMSLLEGHADVVMDGVGPDVIGSIVEIRRRFDVRRQGQGFDKIIRKLLGLDAKMRQYRDGGAFCKAVIAAGGMDGLNRVWTSPETLPTKAEIADPQLWLDRMDAKTGHPPLEGGHDPAGDPDGSGPADGSDATPPPTA